MKMKKNKEVEVKREGFWYSTIEPELPMPEPNVLTEEQAKDIYLLMCKKEMEVKEIQYRGMSSSRITGESLPGNEFRDLKTGWQWPGAFAEHYILTHKVKPTDAFLKYIGYNI